MTLLEQCIQRTAHRSKEIIYMSIVVNQIKVYLTLPPVQFSSQKFLFLLFHFRCKSHVSKEIRKVRDKYNVNFKV